MKHRCLGHLFIDQDRRVEGGGGALCQIGDLLTADRAQLLGCPCCDILTKQQRLAAGEFQTGLAIAERCQRDGCLAGAGFPDQRDNLATPDLEIDTLDDGKFRAVIADRIDLQVAGLEDDVIRIGCARHVLQPL